MRYFSISLATVLCAATALGAQQRTDTAAAPREYPRSYPQGQMQGYSGSQGGIRAVVSFKGKDANLSNAAKSAIDAHMGQLRRDSTMRVMVVDHGSSTDSELVTRRMSAIKGYLVTKGIKPERIQVATRGTGWSTDTAPSEGIGTGRPSQNQDSAKTLGAFGRDQFWIVIASADSTHPTTP